MNRLLIAAIVTAATVGGIIYAANEPAKWEFRNMQPGGELDVLEFKAVVKAATQPTTQPDPAVDYVKKIVRICKSTGEPLPNVLVELFQYRGAHEIKTDSCVTSSEGVCTVNIDISANGRIQIPQQFSDMPIVVLGWTPADQVGPCLPTSIPSQ